MSTVRGPMNEAGLDLILDHWLVEGPDAVPDRVIDGAIQEATATTQRRWRGRLLRVAAWHSPTVPVGLTAVGIAAVVLAGIGLSQVVSVQPGGEETPSPSPSVDSDLTLFVNEADGYELLAPIVWNPGELYGPGNPFPEGVRAFGSQGFPPELMVSIGSPSGEISVCFEIGRCLTTVTATTLADLEAALDTRANEMGRRLREVREPITLDGEPGLHVDVQGYSGRRSPVWDFVLAFHETRPIVIAFDHWSFQSRGLGAPSTGFSLKRSIFESFRFLEPAAPPSEGFYLYRNEVDGYALRIAATVEVETDSLRPGVTYFRAPGSDRVPLIVSVGPPGQAQICTRPYLCRSPEATTLDELEGIVRQTWPKPVSSFEERVEDVTLGGEHGRIQYFVKPRGAGTNIIPNLYGAVYAFRDGRPVVIAFETMHFRASTPTQPIPGVLESFQFLDEEAAAPPASYGLKPFRNDVDDYELYVPTGWEAIEEPAYGEPHPGVVRFAGRDGSKAALVVSVGSAQGDVFICTGMACRRDSITSFDQLQAAFDDIRTGTPIGAALDYREIDVDLGGEPGRLLYPVTLLPGSNMGPPDRFHCTAYAFHGPRPIILSFACGATVRGTGPSELSNLLNMLRTFRFLD